MSSAIKRFDPLPENLERRLEATEFVDDTGLMSQIEVKPTKQYGIDGQDLDYVYIGHLPDQYGLALRPFIFGKNGLSQNMILPRKKSQRQRAPNDLVLKFLSEFLFVSTRNLIFCCSIRLQKKTVLCSNT